MHYKMADKMSTGILSSTLRRLKFIAAVTAIFGVVTFGSSLSIYDWACKVDRETLPEFKYYCGDSFFDCPGKQAWMEGSILAVIASVYQIISSIFMFRCQLGMRSWIVGNVILSMFSLCFAAFIVNAFPNLMGVFICNFFVLCLCSTMGYFIKNMVAFEESSMTLL